MGPYPLAEITFSLILRFITFYPTRHYLYRIIVLAASIYLMAKLYSTPEVAGQIDLAYAVGSEMGV